MKHRHQRMPVVLVTGTSSGIGLELVRELREDGAYRVAATARRSSVHKLEAAGLGETDRFRIRVMDVNSDAERRAVVDEIIRDWEGVDVLVNNAGISYRSVVEHMNDEEEQHQWETNYLAAMALIRLVLPEMRRRRSGRIVNISSVGGMMAMPTMSSYSASKFALEGASESLWYELRPWNIHVTLLQPGFIRSESFQHVYYSKKAGECRIDESDPYCRYYAAMAPFVEKLMTRSPADARDVARKIMKLIKTTRPPLRCPATPDAYLFYWLRRLLPRRFYHRILYHFLPEVQKWGE